MCSHSHGRLVSGNHTSCTLAFLWLIRYFIISNLILCCSRLRQYPLYSKTEPPALLAEHFTPEVFNKSQKYGKHKAKYSLVSGLYRQILDTVQIQSGLFYPWAWKAAGQVIGYFGYGPEYQVSLLSRLDGFVASCVALPA